VLRIMTALLFLEHGLIKLFGYPPNAAPGQQPFLSLLGPQCGRARDPVLLHLPLHGGRRPGSLEHRRDAHPPAAPVGRNRLPRARPWLTRDQYGRMAPI